MNQQSPPFRNIEIASRPSLAVQFHLSAHAIQSIDLALPKQDRGFILQVPEERKDSPLVHQVLQWMQDYSLKKNPLPNSLPLHFPELPPFTHQALQCLQNIPFGETQSYQQVAAMAGQSKAARAVGNACHRNPFPLVIPCHRVISSDATIGGFALDLEIKKRLLAFEA